jgi:hypothetical protein
VEQKRIWVHFAGIAHFVRQMPATFTDCEFERVFTGARLQADLK